MPTAGEAGSPGSISSTWLGIVAPGGMPDAVVQRLNRAIIRIATAKDTCAAWAPQAVNPVPLTPVEFRAFLERTILDQAEGIRAANSRVGCAAHTALGRSCPSTLTVNPMTER